MTCIPWLLSPALLLSGAAIAQDAPKRVILDTDIGGDIDDAFCLALAMLSPEIELVGVTVAYGDTGEKAKLACKMLHLMGMDDVPVAIGRPKDAAHEPQYDWSTDFVEKLPIEQPAADFIIEQVKAAPGAIALVPIGPLCNVGDALAKAPEIAGMVREITLMGGSVYVGYNVQPPPVVEWNIRCDPAAAQVVFSSGAPLNVAATDITTMMRLDEASRQAIFGQDTPLAEALEELYTLWGNETPVLFDPVALAWAMGHTFFDTEELRLAVDDEGMTLIEEGEPNATVGVRPSAEAFMDFYVGRLTNEG